MLIKHPLGMPEIILDLENMAFSVESRASQPLRFRVTGI